MLAAVIVERASGQSFGAFSTERIFQPGGMAHTPWRDDFATIIPGGATGHSPRAGGGDAIDLPYSNLVGNGGLLTTAADLLKWNLSLDRATGEWGAVVRALQTPSQLRDGRAIDYGLGLMIVAAGGVPEISRGGATSGDQTFLARFPERRVSFARLANAGYLKPAPAAHALTRRPLDWPAPPAAKRSDITPAHLAALAGRYHAPQADDLLRLTVREGKLLGDGSTRVPIGPGHFAPSRGGATFSCSAETPLRRQVASRNATAAGHAVAVAKPAAAGLAVFGGSYRSAELEVVTSVRGRPARSPSASGREPRSRRSPRLPTASCSVEAGMRRLRATTPAGSRATNSPTAAAGACNFRGSSAPRRSDLPLAVDRRKTTP